MKQRFEVIRFKFSSPLHLGNVRPDDYSKSEQVFHSDSLYSAIYQCMALLGMEDRIAENPPWTFSSLYPYYLNSSGEYHYFFHRPLYFNEREKTFLSNPENYSFAKNYKQTNYFEKSEFENLLGGKIDVESEKIRKPLYTSHKIDMADIYETLINPRIKKPRTYFQSDPDIFYVERIYFKENGGLFCLVNVDERHKPLLQTILNELGQQGIGTDRNIGNGKFNTIWDVLELELPDNSNYLTNTGLFLPNDKNMLENMTAGNSCWKLTKRGGWISEPHTTYRKKSVFMFSEGSVFSMNGESHRTLGTTARLRPKKTPKQINHEIYRIGKCIFLPMNIMENEDYE